MPLTLTIELTDAQLDQIAELVALKMGKASLNPLTVTAFARAVGKSSATISRLVKAGIIVKSRVPGDTQIPYSELERYRAGK